MASTPMSLTETAVPAEPRPAVRLVDLVAVTKPRLSALVLCTTAGGIWLAPGPLSLGRAAIVLLATSLLVAGAQTLNSYLERQRDALMQRTRARPLAAGRLEPKVALWVGLSLAAASLPALLSFGTPLAAMLGAVAFISYVFVYTPLKPYSTWALPVGAVPGAIPPALGWVSLTGEVDAVALTLFAILFFWQLPHFLAISIYLKQDYARGGFKVFSVVYGDKKSALAAAVTTLLLVPTTLLLVPLGVADWFYGVSALFLGALFFAYALVGLFTADHVRWARRLFLGSLVYLTVLFAALAVGAR